MLDSNFDAKVLAELHQAKSANAELQRQLDELRSGAAAAAAVDERRSKSPSGVSGLPQLMSCVCLEAGCALTDERVGCVRVCGSRTGGGERGAEGTGAVVAETV